MVQNFSLKKMNNNWPRQDNLEVPNEAVDEVKKPILEKYPKILENPEEIVCLAALKVDDEDSRMPRKQMISSTGKGSSLGPKLSK